MPRYLVRWEIDIEAESEQEAAEKARTIQMNPESTATVFDVTSVDRWGWVLDEWKQIDLGWLWGVSE